MLSQYHQKPLTTPKIRRENNHLYLIGDWTKHTIPRVYRKLRRVRWVSGRKVTLDGSQLNQFDTAGALVLLEIIQALKKKTYEHELVGFSEEHQALIDLVSSKEDLIYKAPQKPEVSIFEIIGKATVSKISQIGNYFNFIGQFSAMIFHSIRHFTPLQTRSFLHSIVEMGYQALPIIALLSFLIGIVLSYQLGVQLQNYGANAFIVNLIGQAILREFGPLITAIIGAGRTSASLTAQIGTMKINSEVDALRTMGFSPFDILVIPRIFGALIAFPLLIVWADIFGVLGGMIMTKAFFGTQYGDFLGRFVDVIDLQTFMVGFSKAPAFALIIAMVGCFQGLHVSNTADSLGVQTTKSVVQSIFLIIIVDALYAIVYSKMGI